jgi:formate hydrogenlyase transcriptional activator
VTVFREIAKYRKLDVPSAEGLSYIMEPNQHLAVLRRVMDRMTAMRDPADMQSVLASITRDLVEQAGMTISVVWLYTTNAGCPECRQGRGVSLDDTTLAMHTCAAYSIEGVPTLPRHALPRGYGLPGRMAVSRTPIHIEDAGTMLRRYRNDRSSVPQLGSDGGESNEDIDWILGMGINSAACFPLLVHNDKLVGAIGMLTRRVIAADEFGYLAVLAQQAAISIRDAQLFEENKQLRDRLMVENSYLQEEIKNEGGFAEVVGDHPSMRGLLRELRQVAASDSTVLLLGETGTGKELIARAVHQMSGRKDRPLIKLNCGAIAPGLIESELFGHERGAFTGALHRRVGRFELADRGTIFLDEIGELPLETQTRLLRVLQEQEFERVGGSTPIRVDVRVIAATNRNIEEEVKAGRFRSDLYYRLNVFPARVPPLRERPSDIPLLVRHFIAQYQRKLGKPLEGVSQDGMDRLQRYEWPGNIRELQNVVERACVLARGPVVQIPEELDSSSIARNPVRLARLEDAERSHIQEALAVTGGTIHGPRGAAQLLGINPSTLRSRMEKLGLLTKK